MGTRINTAQWLESQNRWQLKVQKDGERKTFYSSKPGRTGQRETNAKADAWLDDNIQSTGTKISVFLDEYIKSIDGTIATETVEKITRTINNWIRPYIGSKKISSLTEGNLQAILDAAAKKGISRNTGLSKKSITHIREVITAFLKYCRRNRYTTLTAEFLSIPKIAPSKEKRILQPDDLRKLMENDNTVICRKRIFDDYIYAYRFSVLTGIRPGELVGLMWSDIEGDIVKIKRSINQEGRETTGKNENALRAFALNDITRELIKSQRQLSSTDSVFEINSSITYRERWQRFCIANNINYVSVYELRHTFVSIAKSLSDGELRQLVGHSKNMDTYGVYSHELQGDLTQTADKLNCIISNIIPLAK